MHLKTYLMQYSRESLEDRLSDFNLLCYLPKVLGMPLTEEICRLLHRGQKFPRELQERITKAFSAKGLLS